VELCVVSSKCGRGKWKRGKNYFRLIWDNAYPCTLSPIDFVQQVDVLGRREAACNPTGHCLLAYVQDHFAGAGVIFFAALWAHRLVLQYAGKSPRP